MTESFEDAIKALRHIARGNGSVLRIADRIVAAHERETKVEGVCGPITGELRAAMRQWGWVESDGSITFATSPTPPSIDAEKSLAISGSDFDRLCDAIDSIHAQLEREYEDLRMKYVNINRHAQYVERASESLKTELDRVLEEQENRDGWVELPKDADGVPIRFKDKVTVPWSDKVYEVGGFSYQENVHTGTMTIWIDTHIDGEFRALCATDSCHHYAPDTWERIIEDAIDAVDDVWADDRHNALVASLVARCKALAGDAE